MAENLAEKYYQELSTTLTPASVLAEFFCIVYDKKVTKEDIALFGRLAKMFGRFMVWNAIVILGTNYSHVKNSDSVVRLIKGICNNSLKDKIAKEGTDYIDYTEEMRLILEKEANE